MLCAPETLSTDPTETFPVELNAYAEVASPAHVTALHVHGLRLVDSATPHTAMLDATVSVLEPSSSSG